MPELQNQGSVLTLFKKLSSIVFVVCHLAGPVHAAITVYDANTRTPETDFFAFEGESAVQTPDNLNQPTNALSVPDDYTHMAAHDGVLHSYTSNTKNHFLQTRFAIQIDEIESDVEQIEVTWVGQGINTAKGKNLQGANLFIWNHAKAKYELLEGFSRNSSVITLNGVAAGSPADYLGGAGDDIVTVLVESSNLIFDGRQYTLSTDYLSVSITSTTTVSVPAGFNCVASGADPVSGRLYTRLSGNAFAFDVAALLDSDSDGVADGVNSSFAASGDVTVLLELVDTSTVASCAAYPTLNPAASQNLTFSAGDNGLTSASFTVDEAYHSVGCRLTDSVNSVQSCSTDSFAIRPTRFTLSSNMTNVGSSGTPVAKAGDTFTLTATAVAAYYGMPKINESLIEPHVGAVQAGTLGVSFGTANPSLGVVSGSNFTYSEVGSFRFLAQGVYDDTFTAVDQPNDCLTGFSNVLVGDKVGCAFGNETASAYFGRFTPDHFVVAAVNQGSLQATCNGFAYNGESFGYVTGDVPSFVITAENGLATPSTTQNYTGAYSKLTLGSVAIALSADASNLGADGVTPLAINWVPGASLTDHGDGTFDFDLAGDGLTYVREANAEVAAITSDVDLVFTEIRDSDNVLATGFPLTLQPTGIGIRFGRIALNNAYGSELLDLNVPLQAEYFAGSSVGYVTNTLDHCTALAVSDLSLSSAVESAQTDGDIQVLAGQTSQATLANSPFLAGEAGLRFCPPGSPACAATSGNVGSIDIEASAPAHLQFDWDNDGAYDDNPTGRASFGLYPGDVRQIYLREVY